MGEWRRCCCSLFILEMLYLFVILFSLEMNSESNSVGAKFGFDDSTTLPFLWTQEDVQASQTADPAILTDFDLNCTNANLWLTPDNSATLPPLVPPAGTIARDPTPTGGAPCTNDTDCGGMDELSRMSLFVYCLLVFYSSFLFIIIQFCND
jgi:hypothetical protein